MLVLLEQSVSPIRESKPTHKRLITFRDSNEQSIWDQEWHLWQLPLWRSCVEPYGGKPASDLDHQESK
jgi:hypothetical protein